MQLDFAFISQMADFLTDEKLVAWGIGIDGIEAAKIPLQASPMALVARLFLLPDEPEQGHTYAVTIINPDGEEKVLCENETLNTKRHSADEPSPSNLIIGLTIFYLSTGLHRFRLFVDGEMMKEIPIRVSLNPALAKYVFVTEGASNA